MEKDLKDLLLKDLCARLPYGVKVYAKYIDADTEVEKVGVLSVVDKDAVIAFTCEDTNCYNYVAIHEVKPYLFPLSSMTEEQKKEYYDKYCLSDYYALEKFDWFNKNHLDYRCLIEKSLALDATNLGIYE